MQQTSESKKDSFWKRMPSKAKMSSKNSKEQEAEQSASFCGGIRI